MKILEHEILKTLRLGVLKVMAQGSEKDGHALINKELKGYGSLHYGTLVAILNEPTKRPEQNMPLYQWVVKREDIKTDKLSLQEIEDAVQVLLLNNHITDSAEGKWLDIPERVIKITSEGWNAMLTEYYVKEKDKERMSKNTQYIALGALCVTFTSLVITIAQFATKSNETSIPQLDTLIRYYKQNNIAPRTIQSTSDSIHPVLPTDTTYHVKKKP
jgi:hypothetical protein